MLNFLAKLKKPFFPSFLIWVSDQKYGFKNIRGTYFAYFVIKILPFPGDLDSLGLKSNIDLLIEFPPPLAPTGPVLIKI